jgi:nucleoside diphosphate kinase
MEKSVFIIKPEGMKHHAEIFQMFGDAGLTIVSMAPVSLTERALAQLYPDLLEENGELWQATVARMKNQQCLMGIVEGEDAIVKLLNLSGRETDPRQCAPHSIRARFGTKPLDLKHLQQHPHQNRMMGVFYYLLTLL